MSMVVKEATRVFNINLPEPLAQRLEDVAHDQKTDVSELVQWAIRVYLNRIESFEDDLNSPVDNSDPQSMSMMQVRDIIRESRLPEERKSA